MESLDDVVSLIAQANAVRCSRAGASGAAGAEAEEKLETLFQTSHTLAVYGTLAPGKPNHHIVAPLGGEWTAGTVEGDLSAVGWGAALGYPAFWPRPGGDSVAVQVLSTPRLATAWEMLDEFEGSAYCRILVPVFTPGPPEKRQLITVANLYAIEPVDQDLATIEAVLAGSADPEIVACEARIRAAQLAGDVEALDDLISEDLLFTGPDGQLGTKAQDLAAHGSGLVRFLSHEPEELRVRRVGSDVAITSLRARLTVEVGGRVLSGTHRYTRVWAREGDSSWRVVGGHVSEVPAEENESSHG